MTTTRRLALVTAFVAAAIAWPGAYSDGLHGNLAVMLQQGSAGLPGEANSLSGSPGGPGVPGDRLGSAVATGDFDGDGFDDLAIGVPNDDGSYISINEDLYAAFYGRGSVHVLYGSPSGPGVERQAIIRSADISPTTERDAFGSALAVGDFNGDHVDDLAVGAPHWGSQSEDDDGKGMVYLFWGNAAGLDTASPRHVPRQVGIAKEGDLWGAALAAGDFDQNGFDDLAIGMPGASEWTTIAGLEVSAVPQHGAVVILYRTAYGIGDLRADYFDQDSENVDGGKEIYDQFGAALAVGNFDGYSGPDLAIGIPGEDGSGAVAVFYAESTYGVNPYFRYGDQLITQDSVIDGHGVPGAIEGDEQFGAALAAGDLNGNGADDLVIGLPGESADSDGETVQHVDAGSVIVLYGQRYDSGVPGSGHLTAVGAQMFDGWGIHTSRGQAVTVGDFNADGFADVAAGEPGSITNAVTVWYGSAVEHFDPSASPLGWRVETWTQDSDGVQGVTEEGDAFGAALAAGDFNGDGADDLVVGSPGEDLEAGAAHVIPGAPFDATPPTISPVVTGTGVNGWYTSDVGISFTLSDPQSGIATSANCGPQTIAVDGVHQVTCTASSLGGSSSVTVTVRRDTTPPSVQWTGVSPAANAAGWHHTLPSYQYTASDAGAGPAQPSGAVLITGDGVARTATAVVADLAGNQVVVTTPPVNIDRVAPTISTQPNVLPNANGWHNTDVYVTPFCGDALSGVGTCPDPAWAQNEGANLLTFTATDRAGNTATVTRTVQIDKVAPVVSAAIIGTPNANGWYGSAIARFTSDVGTSGLVGAAVRDRPFSDGPSSSVSETVVDFAGNATTVSVGPIKVDGTPPSLVLDGIFPSPPPVNGWYSSIVSFIYRVVDQGAGVASAIANAVISTESALPQATTVSATDRAGNTATAVTPAVRIDLSDPLVTMALSAPGPYAVGAGVTLSYACADPQSGIASCSGPVPSGGAIDTSSPGLKTLAVSAANNAGRTKVATVSYVVQGSTCAAPLPGLQSWWTGDDTGADLLGVAPLALAGSSVGFGEGKVGRGFEFANTGRLDQALGTSSMRYVGSGQPLSIALWARPAAGGGVLFSRRTDYFLVVDNTGHLWLRVGQQEWYKSPATVPFDEWSHIAVVLRHDTLFGGAIYVNGLAVDEHTLANATGGTGAGSPIFELGGSDLSSLGTGVPAPPGQGAVVPQTITGFVGGIDEVMLWRRLLDPAEVATLYVAGAAGSCKTLPSPLEVGVAAGDAEREVTLTARRSGGFDGLPGHTIEFLIDGVVVGSAVTDAGGVATLTLVLDDVDAGSHAVSARDADGSAESAPAALEIEPRVAALVFPGGHLVYGAPAGGALNAVATVDGAPAAGTFTYSVDAAAVLDAGTHDVTAQFIPADPANVVGGSVSATIVVDPAPASIAVGNLQQVEDGTPRSVSVSTTPPGLAVTVTYNGSAVPPTQAGSYQVVAALNDRNHAADPVAAVLEVQPPPPPPPPPPAPAYSLCEGDEPARAQVPGVAVLVRVRVCDEQGRNVSSASLPVAADSMLGPDGVERPVRSPGEDGRFHFDRRTRSYWLLVETRGLPAGQHHLAVRIGDQEDEECVDLYVKVKPRGRGWHRPPHRPAHAHTRNDARRR